MGERVALRKRVWQYTPVGPSRDPGRECSSQGAAGVSFKRKYKQEPNLGEEAVAEPLELFWLKRARHHLGR
jgi:hypothetical protein